MYEQPDNQSQPKTAGSRSEQMERAALILGIVAIVSCTCLYLSLPCGALAIIFAVLSRGGEMTYGANARAGLILGIVALLLTILLYAVCFGAALHEYGSMEGILRAYSDMYGMDYEELLRQLNP